MKKLMDRTKKILVGLVAAFAVYSLAGFFLVPYLIKTVVADKLAASLHRPTSIEKAYFNPYSFSLSVLGFKVMEPKGAEVFASFGELKVNLQGRSLIKGGLTVKELLLDKPYVRAVHNKDRSYNFSDLISRKAPAADEEKAPLKFSFNNIRITGGSVDFVDLPKDKSHQIRDINASIPFVSSIPSEVEIFVKPSFSAKINGSPFEFKGESKPFADSSETKLDINLRGLNLPEYLTYSPVPYKFRMPSGTLTALLTLSYIQYKDKTPDLSVKGSLKFRNLEFQEADRERIARFPALDVNIASVNVFAKNARILSVILDRPDISLVRKGDGALNVMALVPSPAPAEPGAQPAPETVKPEVEKEGPAFAVDIDSIGVNRARFAFADLAGKSPFRISLEPVNISLKGFSNSAGKPSTLKFDYKNPSGEGILVDGTVSVNPVDAELAVKAEALDIRPVQPYLDDMLKVTLTSGRASASGNVSAAAGDGGLRLSYRGGAALTGFSTIDKLHKNDFIKFGSLALDGVEFDLAPRRVVVKSVVLSDFYSNIAVDRGGKLNVMEAVSKPSKPQGRTQAAKANATGKGGSPAYMRVDSVTLKGGRVDFHDSQIVPAYSLSLAGLNGRVKGLFLDGSKLADLSVSGKIDRYAPFEVTGKINPAKDDLFVDMKIHLSGYDLSSVTPYSGRYIGYRIDKGKIFLDLGYRIDKRKLDAKNNVLIDQITLGERVESPQATKLPVSFAISLLKDRRGQIKLDVPLSGSLDDPEFSVGGIIFQVIINLIEKAITAPFALLGSIFGGGADLGYVEFAPGSYIVMDSSAKKLDAIVTALFERPGLKLYIEGFAADEDVKGLEDYKFMRALKAEKLSWMVKSGRAALPVDEVAIGKDEFDKFLFSAYKEADFPKEKNFIGLTKKLPAPELERLLRAHLPVNDDDLRELAASRANAVKDYILATGKVEPARVFTRWPKSLKPEKKEGVKGSRVEFTLE
jgi:hypothetical protein